MLRRRLGVAAIRRGRRLVAIRGRIVVRRRRRIVAIRGRIVVCRRRGIVAIRGRIIDIGHNIAVAVQATPIADSLDLSDHDIWLAHPRQG
jgi:hypothetical protein